MAFSLIFPVTALILVAVVSLSVIKFQLPGADYKGAGFSECYLDEEDTEEVLGYNPYTLLRDICRKHRIVTPDLKIPCTAPSRYAYVESGTNTPCITVGLSLLLEGKDEAGGIIAHEVGHLVHGLSDRICSDLHWLFTIFTTSLCLIIFKKASTATNGELTFLFVMMVLFFTISIMCQLLHAYRQRRDEYIADEASVRSIDNPGKFISFMDEFGKLLNEEGYLEPNIIHFLLFSEHPRMENRVKRMKKILASL